MMDGWTEAIAISPTRGDNKLSTVFQYRIPAQKV